MMNIDDDFFHYIVYFIGNEEKTEVYSDKPILELLDGTSKSDWLELTDASDCTITINLKNVAYFGQV